MEQSKKHYLPLICRTQHIPELSEMPLQVPAASRWLKWLSGTTVPEPEDKYIVKIPRDSGSLLGV